MTEQQHATAIGALTPHRLYSDHQNWLWHWLWRRLGCRETAADLSHDTFVRVWSRPAPAALERPRAYLRAIANGLAVDHLRRSDLERAYREALVQRPEPLDASAEEQARALEALCELDRMLERMPEAVARSFLLAQIEGLKYREIAERLGVSERMVKKYMARALLECALFESERGAA